MIFYLFDLSKKIDLMSKIVVAFFDIVLQNQGFYYKTKTHGKSLFGDPIANGLMEKSSKFQLLKKYILVWELAP